MRARAALVLVVILAAMSRAGVASAQQAAAEALFEQGRQLLAGGKYAEACAKFTESQRLDPAVGTLLNLGDCYAKMGKTATAWAVLKQAEGTAHTANQSKREKIAQARAAALEPLVPRLSIAVPHDAPGLDVRRDGVAVGRTEWATPIPLDPGEHEIGASAPGMQVWSTKVTLEADGKTTTVEVPALAPLPADDLDERAPVKPAPATEPSVEVVMAHDSNVQRIAGLVVGGVGLVTIAASAPFGARAVSLNNQAKGECPTNATCTTQGASDAHGAVLAGTLSTVLLSAGAAVVVTGAILFLAAPKGRPVKTGLRFVPSIAHGGAGMGLVGSW
jgi:hypothetical protein